jgi:undecaprenyl-diphosphatase
MEAMETAKVSPEDMDAAVQVAGSLEAREAAERPGFFRAAVRRIVAWDLALLRWFGSLRLPKAVAWTLIVLVRIGDGWLWAGVAAALYFALPLAELKAIIAHGLVAIAVSLCFYWPIKFTVRRMRPHESGLGITAKVPPLDKFSFPSGHTMNNLAVALTLAAHIPGIWPVAIALPLVLGALRILFGVHFLSDITGGALLGLAAFLLSNALFLSF